MQKYYNKDLLEAGMDEAGRGCLFGRVYVGCVIWNNEDENEITNQIKDSKKLKPSKREELFDYIISNCVDYSIQYAEASEIDNTNISNEVIKCMHKCIDNLNIKPDFLLVDGNNFISYKNIPYKTVIDGDNKFISIAAGSILAKVAHDRYIVDLCYKDPLLDEKYNLLSNKGYGTSNHIEGIKKNGITPMHRKTFGICSNY